MKKTILIVLCCMMLCSFKYVDAEEVLKDAHICNNYHVEEMVWREEVTPKTIKMLEQVHRGRWMPCPICGNQYSRGEYFSHHSEQHITRDRLNEYKRKCHVREKIWEGEQ